MPIIYRQRSPSFSESDSELENENIPPVPTDADDSIVLSDLVRTGEASRLRRRGAMRLDHGYGGQTNPPRVFSPTVIVVGSPTWESEPEDIQGGPTSARDRAPRYTSRQPRPRRPTDDCEPEVVYTLFCGAEESEDEYDTRPCKAYEPSILPLYPPTPSASSSSSRTHYPRRKKKSNGCGAVLHVSAVPRQRQGTWSAKGRASSAVVSLDACYFDSQAMTKIVRSSCGCMREGIGCAVCGNPLGTRFRACKDAGDGASVHRPKPPGPLRPEGPRYWREHGHPHSQPSSAGAYNYTFFPTAVSSYPCYTFPESHSPTTSTTSRAQQPSEFYVNNDTNAMYTNTMFDRLMTASPTPLSDVGEEERESPSQGGFLGSDVPSYMRGPNAERNYAEFDPDGEFIAEPSSPKMNETMLFPER